jgi:hypothetical protein
VDPTFATAIQPIFERRCVPCHACFDSPCQLTLQSFEGLDRGSNKAIVYYPERPSAARPTRMFQDAQTTATWQSDYGFFPVVDRDDASDLGRSILWRYVAQRADHPSTGAFDVDTTTTCPATVSELDRELHDHPERGMPFGFPPLGRGEMDTLAAWLQRGAGGPASAPDDRDPAAREVDAWEDFLNGADPRTPLVSAYLFEHLFYAHLHFDDAPGAWFRVVRSRTPKGAPIDEIATRRPYDDPGTRPFSYRLDESARPSSRRRTPPTPWATRSSRGSAISFTTRPGARPAPARTTGGPRPIRSSRSPPSPFVRGTSSCSTTRTTTCRPSSTGPSAVDKPPSTSSKSSF